MGAKGSRFSRNRHKKASFLSKHLGQRRPVAMPDKAFGTCSTNPEEVERGEDIVFYYSGRKKRGTGEKRQRLQCSTER